MKLDKMSYKAWLVLFGFTLISFACSDNPVSPDSDPPILPELENIAPDIDFFSTNTPGQGAFDELYSNYYEGRSYALSGYFTFSIFASLPTAYLSMTDGVEPEFKMGNGFGPMVIHLMEKVLSFGLKQMWIIAETVLTGRFFFQSIVLMLVFLTFCS